MTGLHDIDAIREALGAHMARTGLKAKELSVRAGLNETAVRDLMDRTTDPRIGTLYKLAKALNCSPSTLFGGLVQLNGSISAGGAITPAPQDTAQFVARPPDAIGELMAFRIDGQSMMPAYRDKDTVYVARDDRNAPPAKCIGEECVVQTASGALMLKTLALGQTPSTFTLRSFNAADIEDVQVVWCAPVIFVMRSRKDRPFAPLG